jgi:unconventional prefoldin RPB5 interactor 1
MAPQILEALKKQGVTDIPASSPVPSKTLTASSTARDPVANTSSRVLEEEEDEAMVEDVAKDEQRLRSRSDSMKTKKVSFAETTKPSVEETKPVPKTVHQDVVEKLADEGLIPEPLHDPVIPENETPEQAALRQDMLQYNMNDIGKIVAEINLDEQTDDEVYSDEDNDVYAYDSEMEEDEDQWGRSKVKVMSDEYREEMLEIERKLNAKSLFNAGPNGEVDSLDVESKDDSDDEREFATKRNTSSNAKKGVKFAQSLDVQEAPAPKGTSRPAQEPSLTDTPKERPLADSIVERAAPATVSSEPAPKPKRVSAFKAARASESSGSNEPASKKKSGVVTNGPLAGMPSTRLMSAVEKQNRAFASIPPDVYNPSVVPEGPQDRTLAETLVEHPVLETDDAAAQAPDELDPALMRQEIATEYHKIRNRMIQRNGGFTRSQDEDEDPEADADKPRVSRFKAARLAKVAK